MDLLKLGAAVLCLVVFIVTVGFLAAWVFTAGANCDDD